MIPQQVAKALTFLSPSLYSPQTPTTLVSGLVPPIDQDHPFHSFIFFLQPQETPFSWTLEL